MPYHIHTTYLSYILSNSIKTKQHFRYRYNCDRFCNGLKLVEPLEDFGSPIKEAYFPKLDQKLTGRSFPGRVANLKLRNVHREGPGEHVPVDVDSLRRWRDNILAAIDAGFVRDVS